MLHFTNADLFSIEAEAIINTVNCVGVMGKGIALEFKKRFPANFKLYEQACEQKLVQPGQMLIYDSAALFGHRYIINFPTKRHWRAASRLEDVQSGLLDLRQQLQKLGIKSLAMPALGCGLGGLDWTQVRALIEQQLGDMHDIEIYVCEPQQRSSGSGAKLAKQQGKAAAKPEAKNELTAARAALVDCIGAFQRHFGRSPHYNHLQAIAYLLQQSGLVLRLNFKLKQQQLHAANFDKTLAQLENYLLVFDAAATLPYQGAELLPGAEREAMHLLGNMPQIAACSARVKQLMSAYRSSEEFLGDCARDFKQNSETAGSRHPQPFAAFYAPKAE